MILQDHALLYVVDYLGAIIEESVLRENRSRLGIQIAGISPQQIQLRTLHLSVCFHDNGCESL